MRKLVTMLTLAALLFSMVPIATHEAEAATVTVLSEDFQNTTVGQVPTGWVATATPNLVSVVEDTYGNRSLSTTENSNGTANMATFNFASPITTSFSVDLRAKTSTTSTNFEGYFLALKDASGAKVVELLFYGDKISRRSGNNDKTTVKSGIVANQWYSIHVDVDMVAKKYSVAIDGVPITSAAIISFYTPTATEVSQYSFSSFRLQSGTTAVDDIVIVKEDVGGVPTNQAPSAVTLNVYGTPTLGNTLTGNYIFSDAETDPEGTSIYKWYRGTQANGSDKTAIANAVNTDYTIVSEDIGKFLFFGVTPIAQQGTAAGTHIVSAGVYISQPPTSPQAGTVIGNTMTFDSTNRFIDDLNNFSKVFSYKGTTINSGGAVGVAGDFSYYAGANDLKSLDMEVTYNKWTLNFTVQNELSVYEAVYNSQTGTFENGKKVTLLRKLRPELMTSGVQYVKATYSTAEPITPGTKYLRVILPQSGYYGDTATANDFRIDQITIESSMSTTAPLGGYLIDDASSFSMFTAGSDTSNLQVVNPTNIADIRTFGTTSYIKRRDPTVASMMTYAAPAGKDFKNAYVEGYYFGNVPSSQAMEIWTSTNGNDFTLYNLAGVYKHPAFGSLANNSIPDVLQANYLPSGVKFVRVKLIGNIANGFPYLTKMAFGYGVEVPVAPIDTDIVVKQASGEIVLDGVVDTDANGNPTGEWAGSELLRIAGVTDNNGDKHSADIYFKYDERKLYLGAKIKDPTPMINTKTGTGIWNGDVLELFMGAEDLDYSLYPDKKGTMLPTDIQLVLGSGIDFGYQSYMAINGVNSKPSVFMELKKDTDGKGYTMEVAIPLHALGLSQPWTGKPFILNAFLSDGGFASRGQWGWTINGEQNKKVRGNFGKIAFEPSTPPASEMNVTAIVDPSRQFVTVSGQTFNLQNKYVTMAVQNATGTTIALDQTVSDEDGNFTFQFDLSRLANRKGSCTVKIGGQGIQVPQTTAFTVGDATSTISPLTASFDKNVSKQADVNVDLNLYGNTLTAIKNETNLLAAGTDYVVNGTHVVLSKTYLATLPIGNATFSFEFSAGAASALTLQVINTIFSEENVSIVVNSNALQVSIPAEDFSAKGKKKFDIKSDELNVSIPSEVVKQVAALSTGSEWNNAVATFNITPLAAPEFQGIAKVSSENHNFVVTLTNPSGQTLSVNQFDEPITLRLDLNGNAAAKRAAIDYILEYGLLSYIGVHEEGNHEL
ncbi:X2-like carbohydrate binding domain-containing protein [Paenibacillus sp. Soil750]|uniref:X2-like carbohydrate binding domain-containing protein n=1 Tax=Paenibacillus sp. Soil750 TaxID=1736398 RepID=UPI000701A5E8|nr:X2-like carbohydrate binding domain-containing protein [Paenibacillus sp. Soil750]KRE59672.1 hypothetical protein ASL11_25965 [Paenibacillus sp. Soil750]